MPKIVLYPDPVLRKLAKEITTVNQKLLTEAKTLSEMLEKSGDGAGLAGPQIGVSKRMVAVYNRGKKSVRVMINPVITQVFGKKMFLKMANKESEEDFLEGCLSFPGLFGTVKRYYRIEVKWQELVGKKLTSKSEIFEGFLAIVLQHEIDHLDGILFVDHVKKDRGKFYKTIEGKLVKEKIEMVLK